MAQAQSVSPWVIGAQGTHADVGSAQVATTLGEVRTATAPHVTQGFHQPWITVSPTDVDVPEGVEVDIYPNPTTDILNINVTGQDKDISARMFDMHGREVANVQWNGRVAASMNVGHLAVGTYLLELYT